MDNARPSTLDTFDDADADPFLASSAVSIPTRLFLSSIVTIFNTLRPYIPQLVPVFVCILLIPAVVLVSVFAGFLVWRNIAVSWDAPIHLQFGDGQPPYASTPLPPFVPQRYDISVLLTIPAVESNFALGNFMTALTLTTPSNQTLASVRQPAIAYSPQPSFFRQKPNTITISVRMLSSFHLGSSDIVASVQIGRRDSWSSVSSGTARELSVISASIRGSVVHYGIRGLVARFPMTSALLSTATFMAVLSCMLAACTLPTALRSAYQAVSVRPEIESASKKLPSTAVTPEFDTKPLTRRRKSKARLGTKRTGSRAQASAVSTSQAKDSIRRRASRISDIDS